MFKWQKNIMNKIKQFQGRGLVQITGRQLGKSNWTTEAITRLQDDLGPFKLKLSEYDFNGTTYYIVKPVGWMHKEELTWNEMITWVVDTFGPTAYDGVWTPGERWYANNARFYFKDIKDRDWFVLRWSV